MKEEHRGFTIYIERDEYPDSPRNWCNLGTMLCWHRDYKLGDEQVEHYQNAVPPDADVMLPLYLYDHSGITMRTRPFSCHFDSGQVGYIYVTRDEILAEYGSKRLTKSKREKVRRILQAEVEIYDQWLRGDMWGYIVKDMDSIYDSCYGFYGYDYCLDEAKSIVNHYIARERKQHIEQVKSWLRNKVPLIYREPLDVKFSR